MDLFDDQMILLENVIIYTLCEYKVNGQIGEEIQFDLNSYIAEYINSINSIYKMLKNVSQEECLAILSKAVEILSHPYCETPPHKAHFLH